LQELAEALDDLSFDLVEPDLGAAARWVAVGLTAYDAAYVAVAEAAALPLITSDRTILDVAPGIARHPGGEPAPSIRRGAAWGSRRALRGRSGSGRATGSSRGQGGTGRAP